MCEDAPCCGCCGVGPGGVVYTAEYPLYSPDYDDDDEWDE